MTYELQNLNKALQSLPRQSFQEGEIVLCILYQQATPMLFELDKGQNSWCALERMLPKFPTVFDKEEIYIDFLPKVFYYLQKDYAAAYDPECP